MMTPHNYLAVIMSWVSVVAANAVNRSRGQRRGIHRDQHDAQALLMSDADVKLDVGRDSPAGWAPAPIRGRP